MRPLFARRESRFKKYTQMGKSKIIYQNIWEDILLAEGLISWESLYKLIENFI